jgi:hypothetical protein
MAKDLTKYSSQYIHNYSFDDTHKESTILPVETDGTNLRRKQTDLMAIKVTTDGSDTYVAYAPIGTAQATEGWQCKKINTTGADTTVTYADGNANFDNAATDLTALSYS